MRNQYILAMDPSGNYVEGKGITGWVLLDSVSGKIIKFGTISAENYKGSFEFWDAHINLLDGLAGFQPAIVIEDYRLYHNRAVNQINSLMETPRLIGVISYECYKRGYWTTFQTAVQVKTRWSDEILVRKGFLTTNGHVFYLNNVLIPDHVKDAVRHAVHYATFRKDNRNG